ncbi:hypothetical protein QQ965_02720 [Candidatus Saccharibacteria bacterium oral taxon 955]
MILYLCLEILIIAAGVAIAYLSMRYEWRGVACWIGTLMAIVALLMPVACFITLFESGKEIEQASVVVKVFTGEGRSLEMANSDIVERLPDQQACLDAKIGDLVTYRSQWHASGMWVERREVILVSRPEQ